MSETNIRVDRSTSKGHLAFTSQDLHVVFATSLRMEESFIEEVQWFSYFRIIAGARAHNIWKLGRSSGGNLLTPEPPAPFDDTIGAHILAMMEEDVDPFIKRLGQGVPGPGEQSETAAERLYQAVRDRRLHVGGAAIEACATYYEKEDDVRLLFVHEAGGYSIGVPPREGIASEFDLLQSAKVSRTAS